MPGPAAGEGKVPFRNAKEEIRVGFGVQGSEGGGGGREKPGARGQRQDIVWRNVFLMSLLHLGAVYSLVLIPKAQPLTLLWAYFCFLLTALGVTAGAHRLWSHRSYKAKLPLRIFLAAANSMAFQVASQPESCLQTSCNFLLVKYGPRTTSSSGPGTTESTTSTRRRTLIPTTPAGASSSPISGGCLSASIGMLSRRGGSLTSPTCWLILWSGSRESTTRSAWCSCASWSPHWCPGASGERVCGIPTSWPPSSATPSHSMSPGWSTVSPTCTETGPMTRTSALGRTRSSPWVPSVKASITTITPFPLTTLRVNLA
ncbi:stearoyl-CoA desaturase 5 isoform X4 [Tursiops truncatus]|uniref:stearoyl-CoA desaturase 5 isoform X4 n=1 Tax=Tursiops truncatus TaxID=9739 RepID=UPI003CCF6C5A